MNVVLIVLDDLPRDALFQTYFPHIYALPGRVTFPWAYVHWGLCATARAAILTGQYNERNGVVSNSGIELDETNTIAIAAQAAGAATCISGKYLNYDNNLRVPAGWDDFFVFADHPPTYLDYDMNDNGVLVPFGSAEADYATDVTADRIVDFIDAQAGKFFAYWCPYATHSDGGTPVPAARHTGLYPGASPTLHPNSNVADVSTKPKWLKERFPVPLTTTWQQHKNIHMNGLRNVMAVSEGVQAIWTKLVAKGIEDETVIFICTDNGNHYDENRLFEKTTPYDTCANLQLQVVYPGAAIATSDALVSNIDLASTICDILDARMPQIPDGMSFVPLLTGELSPSQYRRHLYIASQASGATYPWFRGVVTDDHLKFIKWDGNGAKDEYEMYDMRTEIDDTGLPQDITNLITHPAYQDAARELDRALAILRP